MTSALAPHLLRLLGAILCAELACQQTTPPPPPLPLEADSSQAEATPAPAPRGRFGNWSAKRPRLRLLWQNDSWWTDSDRFFTNGAEIGVTFAAADDSLSWLPFRGEPTVATHEIAIGQDMYTPEEFETPTPDPNDRPYAGWLHLSYRHELLTLGAGREDRLDTWELELGIVGPSSLADDTQIQVHEFVDAPRPQGWASQLRDEPGILLGYGRHYRTWFDDKSFGPFEADLVGQAGFRLGNVDTSVRLGSTVRFGYKLPRHLGSAARPDGPSPHRVYLQAGVTGRLVLRNIFLDGNSYRRSPSVDRNFFVSEFHVGAVWELPNNLRFSVIGTFRTPEFDSPSTLGDPTYFTSMQLEMFF
ncbi:MAG: lipid A deacylase LpxR family protein [Planctomycetota bacterium]